MKNELNKSIGDYIAELNRIYKVGNATEHSYRPALQRLLENITQGVAITNEPKQIACGAPDYVVTRKGIPIGYIEAKDIVVGLDGKQNKEQFDRYKKSLDNLIITNYLVFRLFENGELSISVTIGKVGKNGIEADSAQFEVFAGMIGDFTNYKGQNIRSSEQLSKMMAAKARLMAGIIEKALDEDAAQSDNNSLTEQLKGFRDVLIHDITTKGFADIYAQTIAYGMFAACLHDETSGVFSREAAARLIPPSNPFLRKLFQYIAGYDLDVRIRWVVDALADMFNYADMGELMKHFGQATHQHDPVIHFYETFLSEYDPALRKSRGVWYTPQPVVQFIVRAVDDILKQQFGLSQGLSDTSKIKVERNVEQPDGSVKKEQVTYHKVQILDPAAGTGTFLSEVVKVIHSQFAGQQGLWKGYVGEHLIPRLNGFEILMASYAMAHLKLDMLLQETGYKADPNKRLRVFLTNSLEEAPDKNSIIPFARWLSDEANEASSVKRDTPVMVVLGNPPYSGISQNNGKWITDLIEDYKYVDGVHFKEKKHWLQDDYVKFIRYGQEFVEKNGEGILAYINNHSFLDNPTFRGMRWSLLQTFDEIYILDLHGNARKKEVAPDGGGKDENVFDIQQGVSINIFVKTGKKGKGRFADVLHYDLYGDRNTKYETLQRNTIATIKWERINCQTPYFFFVPKNDDSKEEYEKGFGINQLFPENVTGIVTMGDNFIIADDEDILKDRISKLINSEYNKTLLDNKFNLGKNYSKWIIGNKPQIKLDKSKFVKINYRPFDVRWTYFDNKLVWRLREKVMQHFLKGENVGLMVCRQQKTDGFYHCLIHNNIVESSFVSNKTSEIGYSFPLYLYSKSNKLFVDKKRKPNLNINIVNEIAQRIGLQYTEEKEPTENTFAPIDIIDYIYAVLHSPAYREQYKEFLKIDFPRVPYPQDAAQFRTLVAFGAKLRKLHLLEGVEPVKDIATYPKEGSNKVEKPDYADGKVWINDVQYFEYVPREAWEFYIGGYQPAQKWLKDRKGRQLGYEDIRHYQKMIMVLLETSEIQKELNTQKIYIKI